MTNIPKGPTQNSGGPTQNSDQIKRQCFKTGTDYGRIYGRLDTIRTIAEQLASEASPPLQQKEHDEIIKLRDQANRIIGLLLDASKRDAYQLTTSESHPEE